MQKTLLLGFLIIVMIASSCKKEDPPPELNANAGMDQVVSPLESVSLDGSASTGPDGFTYLWTYSGNIPESEISFSNTTTASPSFTPPKSDIYRFTLTISHEGTSSTDMVTVTASGGIEIGGILTENLELIDIEPDADVPDYIVTEDLVVSDGLMISAVEDNIVIYFEEGTGLHVKNGGIFTNLSTNEEEGFELEITGDSNGWKGIWIDNGSIELFGTSIEKAGKTAFEGLTESAALTLSGGKTYLEAFETNEFKGSFSYDILVIDHPQGDGRVANNLFSYAIPVKAPITFMEYWSSSNPNRYPSTYDYVHLIPGGAEKMDEISGEYSFSEGGKYYIDGDFWTDNKIFISKNTKIFMKEGSGILSEDYLQASGAENDEIVIEGLNGANWKGIACSDRSRIFLDYTTINNAGFGIVKMGSFEAKAAAAIYSSGDGRMEDSQITNSGGFGYYCDATTRRSFLIKNSLFQNTAQAATRMIPNNVETTFFTQNHANIFELGDGIPAVLIDEDGLTRAPWFGLGGDNFYLMDAELEGSYDFQLKEGVHLKFKAGRSIVMTHYRARLLFHGTKENPITIDSELDTPGSWGGIYMNSEFQMEHTTISNGGEFLLPNASEKANIVSAFIGDEYAPNYIRNCTISNSTGYGIVVEPYTLNYDYDAPDKNNTFTDNASGSVIVK